MNGILLGRTSERTLCFLLCLLRVSLGVILLTLGTRLLLEGGWDAWMKLGGMLPTVVRGPFEGLFIQFWESALILNLVIFASFAVGLSMVLGLLTRLGALGGALMMVGFYLATLPPLFGWVNYHFCYFGASVNFLVIRPAHPFGLDAYLRPLAARHRWLRWVVA